MSDIGINIDISRQPKTTIGPFDSSGYLMGDPTNLSGLIFDNIKSFKIGWDDIYYNCDVQKFELEDNGKYELSIVGNISLAEPMLTMLNPSVFKNTKEPFCFICPSKEVSSVSKMWIYKKIDDEDDGNDER